MGLVFGLRGMAPDGLEELRQRILGLMRQFQQALPSRSRCAAANRRPGLGSLPDHQPALVSELVESAFHG